MDAPKHTMMERLLDRLAGAVYDYPRWFVVPQIVLFALAVFYTATNLKFSTDRNELVGADKKYHQNFLRFKEEFPSQDDLVAIVESENLEKNRQFVERLGARVEAEPEMFTNVFYKGDLKMMGPKALLFLPEETLQELKQTLQDYRPFISQFGRATNLNSLFRQINQQFRAAAREEPEDAESLVKSLPALERIVEQAAESLIRPGVPPSPGVTALFDGGQEAEQGAYITFAQGRIYLVTAHARTQELNFDAVERLRELVRETQREVTGVNVGVTGEPVLELDEMKQAQRDTAKAALVALSIVAFIFIYAYHETRRPIKATLCLLVGVGYTLGYATLAVGHLNILTITFVPILIGLAIDFGVHLITRYEEELRLGASKRAAMGKAMVLTGMGIFTSGFTTAGAFFAMALTDFKGIKEMGLISGGGLLICLIPMMTLLPVLLLRGTQNIRDHKFKAETGQRERIEKFWLERPALIVALGAVLTGLAFTQFSKVYFDYNLLHLQTEGLPAVEFEHKLIRSASKSVLFGAVIADSLEEAVEFERKLSRLPSVSSIDSMGQFLTEDQDRKLELVREIQQAIEALRFAPVDTGPLNLMELSQTLWALQGYLGSAMQEVQRAGEPALEAQLRSVWQWIGELRRRMLRGDRDENAEKLARFQMALLQDIRDTFTALRQQDAREQLRVEDLPATLHNRFIGRSGKFLLQVYPAEDVWQRDAQEQFVRELRTVDPDVTGTPVQLYEYTTLLKESFQEAAIYALIAIVLLVLFHFRSLSCVLLALLPVFVGTTWMVGLMGCFDIPFNPANIMTVPLVIGIGVTSGIHILNRFSEEQNPGILGKSTGKAVMVSALTTMAGFGSLILAKHQGIESLGYVMSIGVATCMIAALTFLPAVLNLLIWRGWRLKKAPLLKEKTQRQ